jgi:hypothetical protein
LNNPFGNGVLASITKKMYNTIANTSPAMIPLSLGLTPNNKNHIGKKHTHANKYPRIETAAVYKLNTTAM